MSLNSTEIDVFMVSLLLTLNKISATFSIITICFISNFEHVFIWWVKCSGFNLFFSLLKNLTPETGLTLNVHKAFRRSLTRLLHLLCTFKFYPVFKEHSTII